jgi:uncharacterized repeat protein (TIGR01451 family)
VSRALLAAVGAAIVVASGWHTPVALGATPPDPSKITATCFASDNDGGPFSATDPVTLWDGAPLVLKLGYRNDDRAADPAYFAHFTARIAATNAFGAARTIDTSTQFGGGGNGQGTVKHVKLPTTGPSAQERVVVEITSDMTSGVLATCDFQLTVKALNADLDGDGLSNDVEMNGLRDTAGNLVMTAAGKAAGDFPALGATPCRKDLFIQLNYQTGVGHDHAPRPAALAQVKQAFSDAPVPGVAGGCPFAGHNAGGGIHLGVEIDDPLPAESVITNPDGSTSVTPVDCGNLPLGAFDPARRPFFLYSVWVHQSAANSQSGLAPCAQRSFIGSLGLWSQGGTVQEQAGTFMHELGHVLGLGHGGNDPVNLKPNYLSVMNYSFQMTGIPDGSGVGHADYSRSRLPTLDEALLDEGAGILGPAGLQTRWWGPQPAFRYWDADGRNGAASPFRPADGPLDWNQNGSINGGTVSVDVNSDGQCTAPGPNKLRDTQRTGDDVVSLNEVWNGDNRICDSRPSGEDTQSPQPNGSSCVLPGRDGTLQSTRSGDDATIGAIITLGPNLVCDTTAAGDDVQFVSVGRTESRLFGFDDWAAVDWRIGPTKTQPAPGVPLPPVEPHHDVTEAEAHAIESASAPSTQIDLEVRTRVDIADALPDDTLTFHSTVANTGTATASNVRLVETLPDGSLVTRSLPDLAPGESATAAFTYAVPLPIADGTVLTGTAKASGEGPGGTPERELNNNTASASATARSAPCRAIGAGAISTTRSFAFSAGPFGQLVSGSVSYRDSTPGSRHALASARITGIACFKDHARIFGMGTVAPGTPVSFRLDVDDDGIGPGTDRLSIGWSGYSATGILTRGDIKVGP